MSNLLSVNPGLAMHISEGILSAPWAVAWFAVAIPFVAWGLHVINVRRRRQPKYMAMLSMVGAAVFVISCMPIPVPVAGSCSHACGTGLAAILVGPFPAIVLSAVALLLQALFMAHGGLTTLGANILAMGVVGSLGGWAAFVFLCRLRAPVIAAAFAAGLLADWGTYATTSGVLAAALHGDGSCWTLFQAIAIAFVPTQLPLGVLEGFLTAGAYRFIVVRRPELLVHPLLATEKS